MDARFLIFAIKEDRTSKVNKNNAIELAPVESPDLAADRRRCAGRAGRQRARWLALAITLLVFALSIPLFSDYDAARGTMQFLESHAWISAINANYHLGVDGISIALILLTTFTTVLVILG